MDLPVPVGRDMYGAFCAQGAAVVNEASGTPFAHDSGVLFGSDVPTLGIIDGMGFVVKGIPVCTLVFG